ncbi:MAG TPA: class I adenylate-forming enzyme family protein [Anaerolineae bacterium]|nr:class I adenylate-forming enzyme family protein [Anaerolineae bacterium]
MPFMTFNDMLRRTAMRVPEKTFLYWTDKGRSLTYAQGEQVSDQVAGALAALGVDKGDRVGIFAHNGLDYVMAMFGAWKLGAISAHVSVLQAENLAYFVNDAEPKVFIYTGDMHPVIERNRANMPSVQHYICYDGAKDGSHDWSTLLHSAPLPPAVDVSDQDPAHLSYTSGSSGKPKGAVLPHGVVARATNCIAERLGLSSADISLGPTSLASSYHLVANLLPGIHRGVTIGMMSKWNPETAWEEMDQRGVTVFVSNPLLLTDILNTSRKKSRKPKALRIGVSGGAPVPVELKRAYQDELGVILVESYGQSELGGFVALGHPRRETGAHLEAIGSALPDKEVRIADENGNEVAVGQPGEMILRGGYMWGYWRMPEKTAETLRGDWLHTGDMGRMDSEGYIYMLGRWSERIVSKGQVIFPRPMEEALLRHPAVRYVAVIGRPDSAAGEIPKAIVALYDGKTATPEELLQHTRAELGDQPTPESVEIIPEMPMTPTGKIAKNDLKQREIESMRAGVTVPAN